MATLAQVCLDLFGFSVMADVINAGRDLHTWFAAEHLLGISYEEGAQRLKRGDAEMKSMRQRAKVPNFGFPGGLGPRSLMTYAKGYGVTFTLEEAKVLKRKWLEAFPEMKMYFNMMHSASESSAGGTFVVKQVRSDRVRGGCTYTSGCNTWFQGLAADGAKAALWCLTKECYLDASSPLYGVRPWVFIHDEFILEGPEETAHLWAPRARTIMEETMREWTPDVVSRAEEAVCYWWYKGAEPIHDSTGHLLPWVPPQDLPAALQTEAESLPKGVRALWASYAHAALKLGCSETEAVDVANEELTLKENPLS
jgi:hypothetical protein